MYDYANVVSHAHASACSPKVINVTLTSLEITLNLKIKILKVWKITNPCKRKKKQFHGKMYKWDYEEWKKFDTNCESQWWFLNGFAKVYPIDYVEVGWKTLVIF